MVPNSAYKAFKLSENIDYEPDKQGDNYKESPVFSFLCTKTTTSPTMLQLLGNSHAIEFPAGSFRQGVVYYYYVKKFSSFGGGRFIGHKYAGSPLVL